MRYLPEVIETMLSEIPAENAVLVASLEDIMDSANYSSPEGIGLWWKRVAQVLCEELGDQPPMDGWQGRVVNIWMDRVAL